MSYRSKLLSHKIAKEEHELRIYTNPLMDSQLPLLHQDDYQAPLTSQTLASNSKWIIVRNNIHKIRSWGGIHSAHVDDQAQDYYLFLQTRRELRRAKEHIRQVEHQPDFLPVKYFYLPINEKKRRRFNVTHIPSSAALYHPSFGQEPVVVHALLYYFSRECLVPYNSIFQPFLTDVCSISQRNRQHLKRINALRRIALIMTTIVFILIALMLLTLVLSVLKTTSSFQNLYENDPHGGIEWQAPVTTVNSF